MISCSGYEKSLERAGCIYGARRAVEAVCAGQRAAGGLGRERRVGD